MAKTFKFLSIFLFALLFIPTSCYRVENISDFNEVYGFKIVWHTPEFEISGTEIEDSVIFINIDFGEYNFPLHFYAELDFQEGVIDRIVGIDFAEKQILEMPESELRFYVMARSGLSRVYTIRTRITPLDKNVALSRFFNIKEQDPDDILISEEGVTISLFEEDRRRDTLRIFTIAGTFPVTITPEFSIAETSRFSDITSPNGVVQPFINGQTSLRFENERSAYNLTVISESGLANTWAIVMYHAPFVSGVDGTSTPQQREGTDINPRTISATSKTDGFVMNEIFVDNHIEEILLVMKRSKENVVFPLEISLSFDILNGIQTFGLNGSANSATLIFEDWDDIQTFYLLDTEARVSRLWNIGLRVWKSPENMVLAFDYEYIAPNVCTQAGIGANYPPASIFPSITLSPEQTIIRSRTSSVGDIFLYMEDVRNSARPASFPWRFTLNPQIKVSEGATLGELPSFVWTGTGLLGPATANTETRSFIVTAQDGSEKTWYIHIRDMRNHEPSGEADLIGLTISRHVPNFATFDVFNPVTIDTEEQIVTLKLTYDDGAYPLQVWVSTEVSPFARVTSQNNGTEPLIFENENSEQIITITAEDGITTSDWTVRLQAPPREARAEVLNFQIHSMINAQLAQVTINNENGSIRVWLGASATFPVEVTYVMTVSPRAMASIPLRGTLRFNSYQEQQAFTVTAEDGTVRNWNVRLIHERQLPNWNLDAWTNSITPVGWSTANPAAANSTTQTAGNQGSAALLRTGSTLNMISSGTLFLGQFNPNSIPITVGLTDPIRLTHFGKPFATSGHILGIEVDIIYSPGREYISGTNRELGSAVIQLLKPKPGYENRGFVYHGSNADEVAHRDNTAIYVAHAQAVFGNSPGTAWNGLPVTVVSDNNWTRVQLLFDFKDGVMPDFTHLHIVFASSAQGDAFRGVAGSTLRIDNIRILYKEEE